MKPILIILYSIMVGNIELKKDETTHCKISYTQTEQVVTKDDGLGKEIKTLKNKGQAVNQITLWCKTSVVSAQEIMNCSEERKKILIAGNSAGNQGSMELNIIPGKSGDFDLEDFALKKITKNEKNCSFFISWTSLINAGVMLLMATVN